MRPPTCQHRCSWCLCWDTFTQTERNSFHNHTMEPVWWGESGLVYSRRCVRISKMLIMCIAMHATWIWSCSRTFHTSQQREFSFRTCAVLPLFSPGHQNAPVYLTRLLREGCQELHPQDGTSTIVNTVHQNLDLIQCFESIRTSGLFDSSEEGIWLPEDAAGWGFPLFLCSCFISSCLMLTCCTSSCRRRTFMQSSSNVPSRASQAVCRQ